jgi:oligopeptidase B
MTNNTTPPKAAKKPTHSKHHGLKRRDDYAWLRADNWQEVMRDPSVLDPAIRDYLVAENEYQQAIMEPLSELQDTLFAEMRGRIKEDDSSVPTPDGQYAYGTRFVTGGQHPKLIRCDRNGENERVLVDGDKEAEGTAYFQIGGASHSPDHSMLAWAYDDKGSEYYTLLIRDTDTGADRETRIADTAGGSTFCANNEYLFYIRQDENHRPSKVFRHRLGTDPDDDVLVYEEKDPGFFMSVGKTHSGALIVIDIHDHQTSEVRVISASTPTAEPTLIAPRRTAVEYALEENDGQLFILTNSDDAEDFQIVTAPLDNPAPENWQPLIAHKPGCLIIDLTVFKDHMVRLERENGLPRIVIRQFSDNSEHAIAFDEQAYSLGMSDGYEFDTTKLRFTYSSMTTPSRQYEYDVQSRERELLKEQEVPSGHNADDYITERIQATAADGEQIPISVLYKKGTPIDGSAPCLLYGYGSYGMSMPASFSTGRLSLVDRGFVYAIAHVRGGKEKGFAWYKAGRREFKTNTFTDFIACAEHLAKNQYTAHDRMVAEGGSAGGMLMGAIANLAPERFKAIIAEVPFVDVLTTMLDDTLPLTPPEWPEWGNPIADKAAYEMIASYSPIDNVSAQDYPAILAIGGLTDPRVTYWEPAKWVAKLRELKTDSNLLMLKTDMQAGHGGASGRFDSLKDVAFTQAFAIMQVDLIRASA